MRTLPLLSREVTTTFTAAEAVSTGKHRLQGYNRLRGLIHTDQAPASGFPRVRQSLDGSNWSLVQQIAQDADQGDYQFPFDVAIRAPYVQVQYTHGAVDATFFRAKVYADPAHSVGDDETGSPSGKLQFVRSDKDSHFTGAITAGNHEAESVTGLLGNVGVVEQVTLLTEDNLGWEVHFWATDGFDDADLDSDRWLGFVAFDAADGVTIGNATASTYRYTAGGLAIPYQDADATNELHVSLVPRGGAKTAGASGEVALEVALRIQ